MLGDHFTSPVFTAALELWVAARTDDDAARRGRRRSSSGSAARRTGSPSSCSAPTSRVPGVRELVQATLDLVRGLGLANTITDDTRRRGRILDHWADDPRRPR